jgi:hypothetical protein
LCGEPHHSTATGLVTYQLRADRIDPRSTTNLLEKRCHQTAVPPHRRNQGGQVSVHGEELHAKVEFRNECGQLFKWEYLRMTPRRPTTVQQLRRQELGRHRQGSQQTAVQLLLFISR